MGEGGGGGGQISNTLPRGRVEGGKSTPLSQP